jgi:hypothetical protein
LAINFVKYLHDRNERIDEPTLETIVLRSIVCAAMLRLLALCLLVSSDSAGIGGFVTFNFPYQSDRAALLSQISIVVKTPQGSLVDTAEVQPTGYWIVPAPTHRELVISVRAPAGLVVAPASATMPYPYTDVNFQILGFSVFGSIVTRGASEELVHVAASLSVELIGDSGISMTTVSGNDGTFTFSPLPSGTYTLSIRDAVALPRTVVVADTSSRCEPFIITEWLQTGSIVFPDGVPSHSVQLNLTGPLSHVVTTDERGNFAIRGLSVGHYQLRSAIDDVVLAPLSFQVSASRLPTPLSMLFEGIRIHGTVAMGIVGADVILSPGGYKTRTNDKGDFVFSAVRPIEAPRLFVERPYYSFVIPEIPTIRASPIGHLQVGVTRARICGVVECELANLTFSDRLISLMTVTNGSFCVSAPVGEPVTITATAQCGFADYAITVEPPTDDLRFTRVKALVTGSARCIGTCNTTNVVKLTNAHHSYTANVSAGGAFHFPHVEFGEYSLAIVSVKSDEWIVSNEKVVVTDRLIDIGESLRQTAILCNLTVSHEMNVASGSDIISLKRGLNLVRLQSPIVEPADCHRFEPINVRSRQMIKAEVIERKVVVTGDGRFEVILNGSPLPAPYTFWQRGDQKVKVEVKTSPPWYAEPSELDVPSVTSCSDSTVRFEMVRGIEFTGRIIPPLSRVAIVAICNNKTHATTLTDADGHYTLGFHPTNLQINLTATKSGYNLTQIPDTFDFAAEKLAVINVTFERSNNSETKGIILSLSRADGFAQNVVVDAADRPVIISDLEAGDYFMKPVFREHQFTPSQQSFRLQHAEQHNVTFSIQRVKFGISGAVRRITGEAEPDVEIDAVRANGDHQTVVTDALGRFRISGLAPNQTITLLARASATSSVDRVTPAQMKIKMGSEEYRGVRFLSLKLPKSFDILGELKVETDFLPRMNVVLMTAADQVVERFAFPSKLSNFFYFMNLTGDRYNIVVANTDRQVGESVPCPKQEVEFTQPHAVVEIVCETVGKEQPAQAAQATSHWRASTIAFLAVLIWILFFNFDTVVELIRSLAMFRGDQRRKGQKKKN